MHCEHSPMIPVFPLHRPHILSSCFAFALLLAKFPKRGRTCAVSDAIFHFLYKKKMFLFYTAKLLGIDLYIYKENPYKTVLLFQFKSNSNKLVFVAEREVGLCRWFVHKRYFDFAKTDIET